jgi:GNAT superfamily N-acetyltransferase
MQVATYLANGVMRDGTPVRIRAIQPTDKQALQWGFAQLSIDAIYHRFFQAKRELSEPELRYLTELDFQDHVALVAEAEVEGVSRVVGVGRFVRLADAKRRDHAEVAFTVGDEFQGRGVGTLLLEHLRRIAPKLGVTFFNAEVLPDNRQMLEVFEHSGLAVVERVRDGVVHVEMELGGG